jgi:hypothetical protein
MKNRPKIDVAHSRAPSLCRNEHISQVTARANGVLVRARAWAGNASLLTCRAHRAGVGEPGAGGMVAPGAEHCLDDVAMCLAATEGVVHSGVGRPYPACTKLGRFLVIHGILFSLFGQMFSPECWFRRSATLIPIHVAFSKSLVFNNILTSAGYSTCLERPVLTGR